MAGFIDHIARERDERHQIRPSLNQMIEWEITIPDPQRLSSSSGTTPKSETGTRSGGASVSAGPKCWRYSCRAAARDNSVANQRQDVPLRSSSLRVDGADGLGNFTTKVSDSLAQSGYGTIGRFFFGIPNDA